MREVELKAVIPDAAAVERALAAAGARRTGAGALHDRRYDTPDRALAARDHVLRLRTFTPDHGAAVATLDWKGPTTVEDGYKVREERSTGVADPAALAAVLSALGYVVTREIDRQVRTWTLADAVARVERYPQMDVLLEVEGDPHAIERVIAATGIARAAFTTDRLPAFAAAYAARTGLPAYLSHAEAAGATFREADA
jgi:predicted adenylyl cyclase CyaB